MNKMFLLWFFICLITRFYAQAEIIPSDELLAHYPFDGNAEDLSGNGYHASVFGALLTEDRNGNPASAYAFDGINDYIETPVPNSFDALTMAVWVNFRSYPTNRSVIMGAGWNFNDNYLGIDNWEIDHVIEAWSGGCGWNCLKECKSPFVAVLDQWYHVAYVHTGTNVQLFVNGILVDAKPASIAKDGRPLRFGNSSCSSPSICTDFIHADLDDGLIYSRALTPAEIARLYNDGPTDPEPESHAITFIGLSTDPNGDQDVTEFYREETCHIRVIDADINPSDRKARVQVIASQRNSSARITLTPNPTKGSFTGAIPLSSFKNGTVNFKVMGSNGKTKVFRFGEINIRD